MVDAWKDTKKHPLTRSVSAGEAAARSREGPGFTVGRPAERWKTTRKPFDQCLAALGLSCASGADAGATIDVPALDFGWRTCCCCRPRPMSSTSCWPRRCGPILRRRPGLRRIRRRATSRPSRTPERGRQSARLELGRPRQRKATHHGGGEKGTEVRPFHLFLMPRRRSVSWAAIG